jgi:hypothetical protein
MKTEILHAVGKSQRIQKHLFPLFENSDPKLVIFPLRICAALPPLCHIP